MEEFLRLVSKRIEEANLYPYLFNSIRKIPILVFTAQQNGY